MRIVTIIPAAGVGKRFGEKIPKQFKRFNGREIMTHTIGKFDTCKEIDEIIVAAMPEHFVRLSALIRKNNFRKATTIVEGGKTRHESVQNALLVSGCSANDIVLIHDSVRPFVTKALIRKTIKETIKHKCAIPVMKIQETVKMLGKNDFIETTLDRNLLVTAQTPQGFRFDILTRAFAKADNDGFAGTDEASVAEYAGYKVKTFSGEAGNIKITFKDDLSTGTNK